MAENTSVSGRASWRFPLGMAGFVAAFAVHLVTPIAVAAGASAATVGAIVAINTVLNKVLLLATVAILGRDGFKRLKEGVFGAVRATSCLMKSVLSARHRPHPFRDPDRSAWVAPYVTNWRRRSAGIRCGME